VTIPLTSESAPAPAAQIDWVRQADDREVERRMVAAGGGRKGKRAEYRCAACGYGIVVYERPPSCPICSEARWEHVEWRPFAQHDQFSLSQSPARRRHSIETRDPPVKRTVGDAS
jgi:hypothetical protein